MRVSELKAAIGESSKVLFGAGFVLMFTVPMVWILINSGVNGAELDSMPIASFVAINLWRCLPILCCDSWRNGAFIAGSNTEQYDVGAVSVWRC